MNTFSASIPIEFDYVNWAIFDSILQTPRYQEVVITSPCTRYEFPKDRFVTYDESDRAWCEYCGIGREVESFSTLAIPRAIVTLSDDGRGCTISGVPQ